MWWLPWIDGLSKQLRESKMEIGKAGDLAYIDSFAGLVPCKVIEITDGAVTVKITATRGAYKRGTIESHSAHYVVPRSAVRVRAWQYKISPYKWAGTSEGCHNPDHITSNRRDVAPMDVDPNWETAHAYGEYNGNN